MVERVRPNRMAVGLGKATVKTRRKGSKGRRIGSVNEAKRIAIVRAARQDKLPHELLREWAITGKMYYPSGQGSVTLDASERISCARACAGYYKHPKAAVQPKDAPAPVVRVELDEKMVAALAKSAPDKLSIFREVLRSIQAVGGDLQMAAAQAAVSAPEAVSGNARRYAKMLAEGEVAGEA